MAETADKSWKPEGGGGQPADTAPGRQAEAEVWGGGRRDAPVAPIPHPGGAMSPAAPREGRAGAHGMGMRMQELARWVPSRGKGDKRPQLE